MRNARFSDDSRDSHKTLEAFAVESATKGVVVETVGVLLALYQATHARADDVRVAIKRIAPGEIKHAVLAHEITGWAMPLLSEEARFRVETAKQNAKSILRSSVGTNMMSEMDRRVLGLPDATTALRIVS